jgi:dolichol-phosphate mannosyltransferase
MQDASPPLRLLRVPMNAPSPATEAHLGGRLLISTATYNERGNLAELIAAIHAAVPSADVLVTDDNSPDGTGRLADDLARRDPRVNVRHRPGKLGLGTAILAAMRYAMDQDYDLFLNLDADFSHPPRYLPALVAGMRDHDVMIGSRYVPGGGTHGWPWSREFMSRCINLLVRCLLRMPVRDASGGFRCYRVSMLRRAALGRVRSRGYSFQQEVLFRCHQAGARIGEVPIVFENRRAGASKVNLTESVRSISMLGWLGVRASLGLERSPRTAA